MRASTASAGQTSGRGLIVAHGIHHEGMNEHRMVPFARELARAGLVVMTPEMTDLADYRITHQGVSVIRDAAVYLRGRHDLVDDAPVGVLGFSFAGGLSLVAAAEPELAGRVAYVVSVGGHHDLERVLRFLIRNKVETPAGLVPDAGARLRPGGAALRRRRSLRARARSRGAARRPARVAASGSPGGARGGGAADDRARASNSGSSPTRGSCRRWRRSWKRSSTSSAPSWRRCRRAGGWPRSTRPSISFTAAATP